MALRRPDRRSGAPPHKAPPRAAGARRHQRRCCRRATLSFHTLGRTWLTRKRQNEPDRQTTGSSKARRTRLPMVVGAAARQSLRADRKDSGALGEPRAQRRGHGRGGSAMPPWPEQRGSAVLPAARRARPLSQDSEPKSACAARCTSARPLAAAPAASVRPF